MINLLIMVQRFPKNNNKKNNNNIKIICQEDQEEVEVNNKILNKITNKKIIISN